MVRASTRMALVPAILLLAGYLWLLAAFALFESRFVVVFIALGAAMGWLAFKVARRVAFDLLARRARVRR